MCVTLSFLSFLLKEQHRLTEACSLCALIDFFGEGRL